MKRVKQFKIDSKLPGGSAVGDWKMAAERVEDVDEDCTRLKDRVYRAYESLMGTVDYAESGSDTSGPPGEESDGAGVCVYSAELCGDDAGDVCGDAGEYPLGAFGLAG